VYLLLLLLVALSLASSPNEAPLKDPLLPPAHHFPVQPVNQGSQQQPKTPDHPLTPAETAAPKAPSTEPATKEEPAAQPEDVQESRLKCLQVLNKGTVADIQAEPGCTPLVKACEADYKRLCGERHGKKKAPKRKTSMKCMRKHSKELSPECVNAFVTLLQSTLSVTPCDTDFKAKCTAEDSAACLKKQNHAALSSNCQQWLTANGLGSKRSYCWILWVFVVVAFLGIYAYLRMGCIAKENEMEAKLAGPIELVTQSSKHNATSTAGWSCETCTLQNGANDAACTACSAAKPCGKEAPNTVPYMAPSAMPPMAAPTRPTLYPAVYADAAQMYAAPVYPMPAYTPTLVQNPTLKPI
jgi:hypothetical protein